MGPAHGHAKETGQNPRPYSISSSLHHIPNQLMCVCMGVGWGGVGYLILSRAVWKASEF